MINGMEKPQVTMDTWQYIREAGEWCILAETLDLSKYSPVEINLHTLKYIDVFFRAFKGIAQPIRFQLEQSVLDDDLKETEYREDGWIFECDSISEIMDRLYKELVITENVLIPDIYIDLNLKVYARTNSGLIERVFVREGAEFHISYFLGFDEQMRVVPDDYCLSFSTLIDIWLPRTYNPYDKKKSYDNSLLAKLNQPSLRKALEEWEILTGAPIESFSSRYYEDYIYRHGYFIKGESEKQGGEYK